MKILATNDIHQMASKWKELVKSCKKENPDIVAIAGDIFPKNEGIQPQLSFMKSIKKYANQIKDLGCTLILMLGNDDNQLLIPLMEEGEKEGLWIFLNEKSAIVDGYEFVGMPYVPDYPFGYKFWCAAESKDNLRVSTYKLSQPLLINSDNEFEKIKNYPQYLKSKKSINESLEDLAKNVKDMSKSIWLIHAPPSDLFLDVCAHGEKVGSKAVLEFIQKYQPMITIHGHVHESPEYNGHKWKQQEGKTICIQGGQLGYDLYYSIIEMEGHDIKNMTHSIYD